MIYFFLRVKRISLILINFVQLFFSIKIFYTQNLIKTAVFLHQNSMLLFSCFKHNSSDFDFFFQKFDRPKLLNATKMKTSMMNFDLTFKAGPFFSDYLRKVVQKDWKCRLLLKQNSFTILFLVCFCAFVVCLFFFLESFSLIRPLEHYWKTKTISFSEKDSGTSFRPK